MPNFRAKKISTEKKNITVESPPPPPPQFPPLNQASQKKILAKISLPQKSRNGKFQTPKNRSVIPVTWNPEYSPSPPGISVEGGGSGVFHVDG